VVTASHVHLFDRSALGRHLGHPVLAVAFEHALDLVIGCSRQICTEIHALGVPRAKIVLVPNAAALAVAPERARSLQEARRMRGPGLLNVLFLGRLDQQKGIDRLVALGNRLGHDPRIRFRIVGKSVLSDRPRLGALEASLEDPVYDAHDLLAVYTWADVLVLPSLYEGLPLTLLEAMSLGVVPIITGVGAVEEAVRDGIDGWIVSQEGCVREMTARIEQLVDDRSCLRAMSDAAFEAMRDRTWNQSVKELDDILLRLLGRRGRALNKVLPKLLPGHAEARDGAALAPALACGTSGDPTGSQRLPAVGRIEDPEPASRSSDGRVRRVA